MVLVRLLDDSADSPGEVREMTGHLREGLRAALDDLRTLARGIYPPLLAEQGLGAALRAQATRASLPVVVEADGIGRYRRDIEATAYFCVLEALQCEVRASPLGHQAWLTGWGQSAAPRA